VKETIFPVCVFTNPSGPVTRQKIPLSPTESPRFIAMTAASSVIGLPCGTAVPAGGTPRIAAWGATCATVIVRVAHSVHVPCSSRPRKETS
jgi:hypothetical protein